jgi:hypothetical protein
MLAGKDMGPNVSIIGTLIFPDAVGLMAEFAAPGVLTVVLDHASGGRDLSLILQCGRGTEPEEFKICVPKAESGGPARVHTGASQHVKIDSIRPKYPAHRVGLGPK